MKWIVRLQNQLPSSGKSSIYPTIQSITVQSFSSVPVKTSDQPYYNLAAKSLGFGFYKLHFTLTMEGVVGISGSADGFYSRRSNPWRFFESCYQWRITQTVQVWNYGKFSKNYKTGLDSQKWGARGTRARDDSYSRAYPPLRVPFFACITDHPSGTSLGKER